MSEAEALCDRIAIMVNGGLCCITETEKLKKLVGGYNLKIVLRSNGDQSSYQLNMAKDEAKMAKSKDQSQKLKVSEVDLSPDNLNAGENDRLSGRIRPNRQVDANKDPQDSLISSGEDNNEQSAPMFGENLQIKLKTIQEQSEPEQSPNNFNHNMDSKSHAKSGFINSYYSSTTIVTPEQVINKLSAVAKVVLQSKDDDVLRFNIVAYKDNHISEVFKACDRLINYQSIESYEINEMNLEDVFLVCCGGEKEGMDSIAQSLQEIDREDRTNGPNN
jgi:ABC-type multidrug transport system ATPase subunit